MQIKASQICDVLLCELTRFDDERGFFQELYSQKDLPHFKCQQINFSVSKLNVLRGLHIVPFAKLVHCPHGEIYDVVVDVRKESKTYLKWYSVRLNGENKLSLYVPANCAHGFLALQDNTVVVYAQDGLYDPALEKSVNYLDPQLNISWPTFKVIVSEKDKRAPKI